MQQCVNVNPGDSNYDELVSYAEKRDNSNLVIVARSEINRKHDSVKPIAVRNGIYFYVANDVEGALVYGMNPTPEEIAIAESNMADVARIGSIGDTLFGVPKEIDDYDELNPILNTLTTTSNSNGAGLLYCSAIMHKLKEKFGTEFYIIPSSIHEVLIVPFNDKLNDDSVSGIIGAVNSDPESIDESTYLGDHPWLITDWL